MIAPSDVAGLVRQMRAEENFFANRMTGNGEISRIHCIEVATLLREAATALSGEGWQPIEQAPKDGTWIWGRDHEVVYPCIFDRDTELWVAPIDFHLVQGVLPTHFRFPPAPPVEG